MEKLKKYSPIFVSASSLLMSFFFTMMVNAQTYRVTYIKGNIYRNNVLVKLKDKLLPDENLSAENHQCYLKLSTLENDTSIIVTFKNGKKLQAINRNSVVKSELYALTIGQYLNDFVKNTKTLGVRSHDFDLYKFFGNNITGTMLIIENEKLPFPDKLEKDQTIQLLLYKKNDSSFYPIEIDNDSLLLGKQIASIFDNCDGEKFRFSLKLKYVDKGQIGFVNFCDNILGTYKTSIGIDEEIRNLVEVLTEGFTKNYDEASVYSYISTHLYGMYGKFYSVDIIRSLKKVNY